ncbi:glycosyltransferase [Bacillus sp. NEB1478]|uniref:glycosyltransferase n=1 Tax=Bacillus sp. NEB1478 TaxID=3073816 RepID=UPI002872E89A|nr:glycosyltransferase [Bacillus sp. NEB1478]WNB92722.1 glycosyltransferase [Bacillus sp. NEB1478]
MNNIKLSICMMVKNEEENLRSYLPSLASLLNHKTVELIIVDTGSIDNSKKIASEYTNLVFDKQWNDDFSFMRNYTISKAKGEWVFIIDADEELMGANELFEIINNNRFNKYNTIQIGVKNYTYKDKNLFSSMVSPRLFRNDKDFKYVGSVHNQPQFKSPILNVTDVYLNHFGYVRDDKKLMERKYNRTSQLLQKELELNPNNVYYRFQLAQSYGLHGEKERAYEQIEKAYFLLKDKNEKAAKLYIFGIYANLAYLLHDYEKTIEICKEGLNISNEYIDLYFYLASAYDKLANEKCAINNFKIYFDLLQNVGELQIGKSSAMEFHKIDEGSITVAGYKLINLLLKDSSYLNQVNNYINFITDEYFKKEQLIKYYMLNKDYLLINRCITETENNQLREIMIGTIEKHKSNLTIEELESLYEELSNGTDIYNDLNKLRVSKTFEEKKNTIKIFYSKYNSRTTSPVYLEEVFEIILDLNLSIFEFAAKIPDDQLIYVCTKVVNKDSLGKFKKQMEEIQLKKYDFHFNRVYFIIANYYFSFSINNGLIDEDEIINYRELFFKFVDSGLSYLLSLYQEKKLRMIYKTLNFKEHIFIISLFLANQLEEMDNRRGALNYYKEAIETYPVFRKFVNSFFIQEEFHKLLVVKK